MANLRAQSSVVCKGSTRSHDLCAHSDIPWGWSSGANSWKCVQLGLEYWGTAFPLGQFKSWLLGRKTFGGESGTKNSLCHSDCCGQRDRNTTVVSSLMNLMKKQKRL